MSMSLASPLAAPLTAPLGRLTEAGRGGGRKFSPADNFYVRPAAHGDNNGTSWENAIAFSDVPLVVAAINAAGTIHIASWDGEFTVTSAITIPAGGNAFTIRGSNENGEQEAATIASTRAAFVPGVAYPRSDPLDGSDIFLLADGLTNVTLSHLIANNIGSLVRFLGGGSSVTITDCAGTNAYLPINAARDAVGSNIAPDTYTISSLTLKRLTFNGYEVGLFMGAATMPNLLLEDITGDGEWQYGSSSFAEGIWLPGTVVSPTLTRCVLDRSANANRSGGSYWNGDGICFEAGVSGANMTDCGGDQSDDAGLDLKGDGHTITGGASEGNKINAKIWGTNFTFAGWTSKNPAKNGGTTNPEHFVFAGSANAVINMTDLVVRNDAGNLSTLFSNEKSGGATVALHINGWDIVVPPGTTVFNGAFSLKDITPAFPSVSVAAAITWASGHEQGVIDQGTSTGTTLGTLSATIANPTGAALYQIVSDPDAKFAIAGTSLKLNAVLDPSVKTSYTVTVRAYDPSGLVYSDLSLTVYVNATSLETSTQAWYDALGSAGLTQPSRRWRSAYDNFIRRTKAINAGAFWAALDGLMPLISYNADVAKRNLKQNNYHLTFVGTTDWVAKRSWKGNGSDAKITIAFAPASAGGNYQLTSCMMFIDVLTDVAEDAYDFAIEGSARGIIRSRSAANLRRYAAQSGNSDAANTNGQNSFAWIRTNSTSTWRRFIGSVGSNGSSANAALQGTGLTAGKHDTSGTPYTTREYGLLGWGGGVADADYQAFLLAWAQFKAQAAISE